MRIDANRRPERSARKAEGDTQLTRKLKKALFSQWGTTEGKEQMKVIDMLFHHFLGRLTLSNARAFAPAVYGIDSFFIISKETCAVKSKNADKRGVFRNL